MQYIQLQGQVASQLDTPLEGGFNLFIDTNDGTIKAKDSEGNLTSAGGLVETTYNQLTASLNTGSLTPGTYYKITDFRTCYDQPDYNVNGGAITTGNYRTGSLSPIIVFALDSGSLAADAFQPEHPNDNIKYDVTFNQTEVTDSPAFGRIIYRKDIQGNEMDYDFREVRFKRYNTYFSEQVYQGTISVVETGSFAFITGSGTTFENFTTGDVVGVLDINSNPVVQYYEITSIEDDFRMFITGSAYSYPTNTRLLNAVGLEGMSWKKNNIVSNSGSVELLTFGDITQCFSNTITTTTAYTQWEEYSFLLANNVFKGESTYRDNSFGHGFRNNTFNTSCDSNRIGGDFTGNIFNNDFDNNIINDNFYDNIINCDFRRNVISGEFRNNHFGDNDEDDFDYNTINGQFYNNFYTAENDFEYNIINGNFNGNIINDAFRNNIISDFYGNVLELQFEDNQIAESFNNNTFYQMVSKNSIGTNCYENVCHSDFNNNTISSNFYNNTIGELNQESYFQYNQIENQFSGNSILGDFKKNRISDFFYDNSIAWNFQYNEIKTGLDSYDFTQYYGNIIGGVSFTNGIAGTNGTYTAVTGSTNGNGINAEFEIIVANDVVTTVNVTNEGKFYGVNNTITIASGSFGGTADLVLTEDGISSLPEVYGNYNKTIQKADDTTIVLSVIRPGEGYYTYMTTNITQAID